MSMEDGMAENGLHTEMHGEEHEEARGEAQSSPEQTSLDGKVRISEDVISEIAIRALASVPGVEPAAPGLMANLRMGRKASSGVRISVSDTEAQEVQVDTYISVKYGLRIPDVCWDVQEAIKDHIERFSGYTVRPVNVYVQGIIFEESQETAEDQEHVQ